MTWKILQGDNRDTLKTLADNSIDAIVTDPPYGIDFLGKDWDANTGALETYQECLRVLKPGGHILAFSAARTYHHLAVTLEQAGFEIRDQIMWIYSSGFPKSQDVGKSIQRSNKNEEPNDWQGWGTQLKPAHEPIALARKPMKTSIAKNCQIHGVGALNIDATRVTFEDENDQPSGGDNGWSRVGFSEQPVEKYKNQKKKLIGGVGNKATYKNFSAENQDKEKTEITIWEGNDLGRFPSNVLGEIPDYQKYFYCPKVSRKERHMEGVTENNHPTVKPIELMKYLIKLVTPPGGTVLDPFNGSGSTGCAAVELGYDYIGCELDPAYVEITNKRIEAWYKDKCSLAASGLFEEEE